MSEHDLWDAIDRHGGDLAAWPDMLRQRAELQRTLDPAFAEALNEARALDALLFSAHEAEPLPYGMATRIVARASEPSIPRWLRPRIALPFAAAFAGAATLAGAAIADVLASADPELLSLAELALGAAGIIAGN